LPLDCSRHENDSPPELLDDTPSERVEVDVVVDDGRVDDREVLTSILANQLCAMLIEPRRITAQRRGAPGAKPWAAPL